VACQAPRLLLFVPWQYDISFATINAIKTYTALKI